MKKYLFLLVALLIFTPKSVFAVTDISQNDFDKAKKEGVESNGVAYSEEYENFWFTTDGEYRLVTDVTLTDHMVINEADPELVIDLNGNTLMLNAKEDDMMWFITVYASKVTFKGTGTIKSNTDMRYLLIGAEGSNLIIDGCNVEGRIGIGGEEKKEELTIKSGNIGSISASKANITIDDATINSNFLNREAIIVDADTDLVINGGTFESQYGALKVTMSPDKYDTTTITINGGTFIGKERHGLTLSGHEKLKINAGVFTDDADTITITKDDKSNVDKLISSSIEDGTIEVTKGANSKYKYGKDSDLSFTIDREYEAFVYEEEIYGTVYVDEKQLKNSDFSISEGTTITLKKAYLDKLSGGDHSIVIVSGYGDYASTTFTIEGKTDNTMLYVSIIGLCVIVVVGVIIYLVSKNPNTKTTKKRKN